MTTYDNLTVRQYQEIVGIQTSKMDDEDKIIQSICVLTGMTESEVEELTIIEFNKMGRELAQIFSQDIPEHKPPRYLRINGKLYGITYNPRNLSYYQFSDIQAWISNNTIQNMHKVVASLTYPVKNYGLVKIKGKNQVTKHSELSEGVLDCNYKDVHAICVFFSLLWNNSIKALAGYLEKQTRETLTKKQQEQMKVLLEAVGGGFTTQRE